jgi:hypothetical protein
MSSNCFKKLYTNGCSWTLGSELEEDPIFKEYYSKLGDSSSVKKHYNKFNWSYEFSKLAGIEKLINNSCGGGSNARVVRTTISYLKTLTNKELKEHFVIIGWTLPERKELYLEDTMGNCRWVRFNPSQKFKQTLTYDEIFDQNFIEKIEEYQKIYVSNVHTVNGSVYEYFQQIYLLSNLLENLKVNYFFFNALPVVWPHESFSDDCKQDDVWAENKINFLSRHDTMFYFVEKHKYKKATYNHPLVEGHRNWAAYLYDQITRRGLL